jgi:hypothetical protein
MPGYTLVPADYQPDFSDYTLVPVDYATASGSHTITATDGAKHTNSGGVYGHTLTVSEPRSNNLGIITAADPTGLLVATPDEGDPNSLRVREYKGYGKVWRECRATITKIDSITLSFPKCEQEAPWEPTAPAPSGRWRIQSASAWTRTTGRAGFPTALRRAAPWRRRRARSGRRFRSWQAACAPP